MKFFIIFFIFLTNAIADPIRIQGIGSTFEEAKLNAFKNAIELKVGSILLNEVESKNGQIIKKDIVNYSAGYIENFKLIDHFQLDNKFYIILDVEVSSSKISDRILGKKSNSNFFNKELHKLQLTSLLDSKNNQDNLVNHILKDYPEKSFSLIQKNHYLKLDKDRNIKLNIEYEFKWNNNYISALNELLDVVEDKNVGILSKPIGTIVVVSTDNIILFNRKSYHFNDQSLFDNIKNEFKQNKPKIKVIIKDKTENVIHENCLNPIISNAISFDSMEKIMTINSNKNEKSTIELNFYKNQHLIYEIDKIELQMASTYTCKK